MNAKHFHLVSRWRVDAPPDKVYLALVDLGSLSSWWPGVRTMPLGAPHETVGRRARLEIGGLLPVALHADVEITSAHPSREIAVVSHGELEGNGEWRLCERTGLTEAVFTWDVSLEHRGLRRFVRWLRPLLILSHHIVMWRGNRGLKRHLKSDQRVTVTTSIAP
jgi:hypothetical protein